VPLINIISGLPEVIAAIDTARSDPDDLFITTDTAGNLDSAIWPGSRQTVDMQAGQSQTLLLDIPFSYAVNVSLWDEDVSANDLLGSITVREDEAGTGELAKLAKSDVESSAYNVIYEVFS
jgi:hypothetical protein